MIDEKERDNILIIKRLEWLDLMYLLDNFWSEEAGMVFFFHLFVNVENFELFHEKFYNIEAREKKLKKQILGLSSKSTLQL